MLENKLAYAREFGATDIIDASTGDTAAKVHDLTDGGADYAFEAIGNSKTILQAYESTGIGGVTTVVGMAAEDDWLHLKNYKDKIENNTPELITEKEKQVCCNFSVRLFHYSSEYKY